MLKTFDRYIIKQFLGTFLLILVLILASAIGAWLVAVWSAISVVRLAPPGQKVRAYFNLGWWHLKSFPFDNFFNKKKKKKLLIIIIVSNITCM